MIRRSSIAGLLGRKIPRFLRRLAESLGNKYGDDESLVLVYVSQMTANDFARAFPKKAMDFEVHEVERSAEVPLKIIQTLWEDPKVEKRVGAAVWWLSGNETYQSALLAGLRQFPGDIYCQMIGRSDQDQRFPGGYAGAWKQAKSLKCRYVEAWEWDYISTGRGAGGKWDTLLADFNEYARPGAP